MGISLYFTCDETSKLEQVYLELHPDANLGDSGSSSSKSNRAEHHFSGQTQALVPIEEDSEEAKSVQPLVSETPQRTSRLSRAMQRPQLIDNYMEVEVGQR